MRNTIAGNSWTSTHYVGVNWICNFYKVPRQVFFTFIPPENFISKTKVGSVQDFAKDGTKSGVIWLGKLQKIFLFWKGWFHEMHLTSDPKISSYSMIYSNNFNNLYFMTSYYQKDITQPKSNIVVVNLIWQSQWIHFMGLCLFHEPFVFLSKTLCWCL